MESKKFDSKSPIPNWPKPQYLKAENF